MRLYLEDLNKAIEAAKTDETPSAQRTLSQARPTPSPSPKAQAIAKTPNVPAVSPGAKAAVKYEYWGNRSGTPDPALGWEQSPTGKWRRPWGAGGAKDVGEAEQLVGEIAEEGQKDETTRLIDELASQTPEKRTVSSGESTEAPVSSSAAKLEDAKRDLSAEMMGDHPEFSVEEETETPEEVASMVETMIADEGKKQEPLDHSDYEGWSAENHLEAAKQHLEAGNLARASDHYMMSSKGDTDSKERAEFNKEFNKKMQGKFTATSFHQHRKKKAEAQKTPEEKKKEQSKETGPKESPDVASMKADVHKRSAKNLADNIRENLGTVESPEDRASLEKLATILDAQSQIEGAVSDVDKEKLKLAQTQAKQMGVSDKKKDTEQAGETKRSPRKKINFAALWNRGGAMGERLGTAAARAETAGSIGEDSVNYSSSGAVRAGHHLLRNVKRDKAENMKTEKSLPLVLDLQKAVQSPNAGVTTPDEDRAKIQFEASYAKRPVGVANEGIVNEAVNVTDKDEKKWKDNNSESDSTVQGEIDEELSVDGAQKSQAVDILKSLYTEVDEQNRRHLPRDSESQFMIEVLGYDPMVVSKGQAFITGKDRHKFNEWTNNRLADSVASLLERV